MRTDLNSTGGLDEVGSELRRRLQALPDQQEPPFGFDELQRRAHAAGRMGAPRSGLARPAALWLMAASVAALVAGLGLHYRGEQGAAGPGAEAQVARKGSVAAAVDGGSAAAGRAEQWLQQRPRRALVRVDSQLPVMALEDRIAAVDDQLNVARLRRVQAQQVVALQRDRAQLVESLAQVRYAQDLVEMQ